MLPDVATDVPTLADLLAVASAAHDEIHAEAHAYHQRRGGLRSADRHHPNLCLNNCGDVSDLVAERAGGAVTVEEGTYVGPVIWGRTGIAHCWNRLPDGSILDATADQFGDVAVRLVPAGDPRQDWYRLD